MNCTLLLGYLQTVPAPVPALAVPGESARATYHETGHCAAIVYKFVEHHFPFSQPRPLETGGVRSCCTFAEVKPDRARLLTTSTGYATVPSRLVRLL